MTLHRVLRSPHSLHIVAAVTYFLSTRVTKYNNGN